MIVAERAAELGRPVGAVPGPVTSLVSAGHLIARRHVRLDWLEHSGLSTVLQKRFSPHPANRGGLNECFYDTAPIRLDQPGAQPRDRCPKTGSQSAAAARLVLRAERAGEAVSLVSDEVTLTPAQMAEQICVSRASIQRRIVAGEIRCKKVGSRYRIPLTEVERFRREFVREMASTLANDF
jgi:excisionase family DNA binding protein